MKGIPGPAGRFFNAHKQEVLLGGGAVGAVGIALWRRHEANATSTPATDTTTAGTQDSDTGSPTAGGVDYSGDYDTDPVSLVAGLQSNLTQLSAEQNTLGRDLSHLLKASNTEATRQAKIIAEQKKTQKRAARKSTGGKKKTSGNTQRQTLIGRTRRQLPGRKTSNPSRGAPSTPVRGKK